MSTSPELGQSGPNIQTAWRRLARGSEEFKKDRCGSGAGLTRRPCATDRAGHMGKVANYQPLVHGNLALEADAGPVPLAAIRTIRVGSVYAERYGIGGRIDRDKASGYGIVVVLVSDGKNQSAWRLVEICVHRPGRYCMFHQGIDNGDDGRQLTQRTRLSGLVCSRS